MAEQEQQPQGNIRSEFNLGRKGLNMDLSVNQVEKGSLTYALNAAVENYDSSSVNYQNEPGNEFCLNFPQNFHGAEERSFERDFSSFPILFDNQCYFLAHQIASLFGCFFCCFI